MRRKTALSLDEEKDFLLNQTLEDNLPSLTDGQPQEPRIRSLQNSPLIKAALQTAIANDLTDRQRECVDLYYLRGMTMEETGRQLGIGKATVFRHLQRAKKHMERALKTATAMQSFLSEEED